MGCFRHFVQHQELGENQYDLDFHLMSEDKKLILKELATFQNQGYLLDADKGYTVIFKNPENNIEVELVFLYSCSDDLVYHQSKGQRLICDRDCFGDHFIEMFGIQVRVPEEKYLEQVYGTNWKYKREKKNFKPIVSSPT